MNEKSETLNQETENVKDENVNSTEAGNANPEQESVEGAEVNSADQLEKLQKEVKQLKGKLEEADNRYLRLQADFDNFRRRSRLDQEAAEKYRAQNIVTDLLSVLDNFERALQVEADNEQTKSLLQGMDMVYRGLLDALKKEGLKPIEAVGKEFNPQEHHAVMQGEDENFGPNMVIEEFQKGYLLKDRVIRPSMVKVNQ
ncbi:nucleotide exchange factor GrpE [Neobacillus mesonae]|uniref:nucleotide exchange factor GrpE n=1 Tax=Neobacillus mesonae TaxID=1193713 RepID=UPI00203F64B7|nr:nucleotide exchange factor GrpE [Neobacillus mesonae]MCM3566559.1 nucleotide exchange factor GrpE [Neobacillus mesonae]